MKGNSVQQNLAIGGLFQTTSNFNPFETMGYLQPALEPVTVDASTITTRIDYIVPVANGGNTGYAFAIGNRSGTGAKTFYRIDLTTNFATDFSAEIDQNAPTGAITGRGLFWYGNRIIYRKTNELRSNVFTPDSGSDVSILPSDLSNNTFVMDFAVGPDGYLYYTAHNNFSIGRIVTVTGTTDNVIDAFLLESRMFPRGLTMDGRYLVIMGDTNDGHITNATSRCRVYFWDGVKATADIIWDIPDNYLIGGRYVDGKVLILGASGLWACSAATPPKLVFPLTSTQLPDGPNKISAIKNILYWGASGQGGRVLGYGSLVGKPILFSPHNSDPNGSALHTAFAVSGNQFLAALDTPSLKLLNSGSTRGSAVVTTAPNPLPQPFQFAFMKVTLKSRLTNGQTVTASVSNNIGVIMNTTNKNYTTDPDKQTLIFRPNPSISTPLTRFEDLSVNLNPQGGAVIERVAVYGTPIDDYGQSI